MCIRDSLIVYDYYKTNAEAGPVYDIEDLLTVKFQGDGKLEQFLNSWDAVLIGMNEEPNQEFLEVLFLGQIKKSGVLALDLAYYRRLQLGHEDRNYQWLRAAVVRYLDLKRQEDSREATRKGLAGATVATPAEQKAKKEAAKQRKAAAEKAAAAAAKKKAASGKATAAALQKKLAAQKEAASAAEAAQKARIEELEAEVVVVALMHHARWLPLLLEVELPQLLPQAGHVGDCPHACCRRKVSND